MRILTNFNGGPLVKLVKGEGRATRARARSPRRVGPWRDRDRVCTVFVIHVGHSCQP
jgi:hypothetical protein